MVRMGMWVQKNLFLVHVRDYNFWNGKHLPSQKGIALTIDTWRTLYQNIEHINQDVESFF